MEATKHLTASILGTEEFNLDTHTQCTHTDRTQSRTRQNTTQQQLFTQTVTLFDTHKQRSINRKRRHQMSGWMRLKPTASHNNLLSAAEFRAIALRRGNGLTNIPAACENCNTPSDSNHVMNCKRAGDLRARHDEIRDGVADTIATVYRNVEKEVVLKPATLEHDAIVPDIKARGVWQPQQDTMFVIAVVNTDSLSYLATDPYEVLTRHAFFVALNRRRTDIRTDGQLIPCWAGYSTKVFAHTRINNN
eukprot:GHVR01124508.1.p1 GENE.GHVR01124508.1~~GHVR01124508.1.p1  ORF type:complete len:248 (-),score=11.27 GHVR01124508.1:593-1336(-)